MVSLHLRAQSEISGLSGDVGEAVAPGGSAAQERRLL